ncbi:hypothetical protein NDU88_012097 [Pleurodeles waltl]|uniref:Uncharacterized protein n=1 Tax=Pleurodeles waltl TaxID=8319 RepID=A0AAV7R4W4_PLEWA|nr:hypothetical protein NDU88_012097 [Pleurodeles waltl]
MLRLHLQNKESALLLCLSACEKRFRLQYLGVQNERATLAACFSLLEGNPWGVNAVAWPDQRKLAQGSALLDWCPPGTGAHGIVPPGH